MTNTKKPSKKLSQPALRAIIESTINEAKDKNLVSSIKAHVKKHKRKDILVWTDMYNDAQELHKLVRKIKSTIEFVESTAELSGTVGRTPTSGIVDPFMNDLRVMLEKHEKRINDLKKTIDDLSQTIVKN